jgi:predicted N-acetyltransferase YhbS
MTALSIRPAEPPDAPEVTRLLGELGYAWEVDGVRRHILRGQAPDGADRVLVACDGPRVVGVMALHRLEVLPYLRPVLRITALCVDARCRGRGVGRALEAAAQEEARRRGCDTLEVASSLRRTGAHAFYEGLGYAEYRKRYLKALPS